MALMTSLRDKLSWNTSCSRTSPCCSTCSVTNLAPYTPWLVSRVTIQRLHRMSRVACHGPGASLGERLVHGPHQAGGEVVPHRAEVGAEPGRVPAHTVRWPLSNTLLSTTPLLLRSLGWEAAGECCWWRGLATAGVQLPGDHLVGVGQHQLLAQRGQRRHGPAHAATIYTLCLQSTHPVTIHYTAVT